MIADLESFLRKKKFIGKKILPKKKKKYHRCNTVSDVSGEYVEEKVVHFKAHLGFI